MLRNALNQNNSSHQQCRNERQTRSSCRTSVTSSAAGSLQWFKRYDEHTSEHMSLTWRRMQVRPHVAQPALHLRD